MSNINKITGHSPEAKSLDITAQNIEQLKQLFPDVFSEGKIDFEALKAVLGEDIDDSNERYNFTWNGKNKARQIAQIPSTGTLRPCKEESVNWDTTENLFIEGDNLEVLKLLQKSYHKKIKMIYIDPPYNTGKDFVYKDNFHNNIKNYLELTNQIDSLGNKISTNSETSGRYHSDWLNMIYPRLKLARNLLKEDGVIFISIDDNECFNLKIICDEIFGENNFLGMFIINASPSAIDYGHMAKTHEYALFYAKNNEVTHTIHLPDEDKVFKYRDDIGEFNLYPLYNGNVAFNPKTRPNLFYPFYLNPHNKLTEDFYEISVEKKDGWIEVFPVISKKDGVQRVWRWGKTKASAEINKEIVGYMTSDGEYRIVQKTRLTGKMIRSLQLDTSISSRKGTAEVESLFGAKIFPFPKPIELLKRFIKICTDKNDIILDFFAGSASCAHAVMSVNSEDNLNRKFIGVQIPEQTAIGSEAKEHGYQTISDISKDRIRKAAKNLRNTLNDDSIDLGFKSFKLDETNIRSWDADFNNLEQVLQQATKSLKDERTNEDVLYEIFLKYGYELTTPVETKTINGKTVFVVGAGALIVCLDDEISTETVEGIANLKAELDPETTQIVFKDEGFTDDRVKTNAIQILKQAGIEDVKSI
ncbi:TPA: site-specific DNA-methyltransferase [Proteus mirabilis]